MGARISKYMNGTNETELETPPGLSVKRRRFLLCDPRSPSIDVIRTPIQMDCSVGELSTPMSKIEVPRKQLMLEKDPRSPTEGIFRTPVAVQMPEDGCSNQMTVNAKTFLETDLDAIYSVSSSDVQTNSRSEEVSTTKTTSECPLEDSPENIESPCEAHEKEQQETENEEPGIKEEIDKLLKKLSESYPTPKECKVQYSKFHNELVRKQSVNALKKQLFLMPDKKDMFDSHFTQDRIRRPLSNVSNVTATHQKLTSTMKSVIVKEKYTSVKQSAAVKENFTTNKSNIMIEEQSDLISGAENTPPKNSVVRKCQPAQWDQDETVII